MIAAFVALISLLVPGAICAVWALLLVSEGEWRSAWFPAVQSVACFGGMVAVLVVKGWL